MIREISCDQGSPEWFEARRGIVTASEFSTVMAKGKTAGSPSVTRRKYMLTLLGERMTGEVIDSYSNAHMERGKAMEEEARDLYLFRTGAEYRLSGTFVNDEISAGASPDLVIGDDGLVEIKTKIPHLQLELLLTGGLPSEHKAQVQGQLLVTGRKWVDFVSYWPKLPVHIFRVHRDEEYIATLRKEIVLFNSELSALQAQMEGKAA